MKTVVIFYIVCLISFNGYLHAQTGNGSAPNLETERALHQNILKTIKNELKSKYYDPTLRGLDIEANAKKAGSIFADQKN